MGFIVVFGGNLWLEALSEYFKTKISSHQRKRNTPKLTAKVQGEPLQFVRFRQGNSDVGSFVLKYECKESQTTDYHHPKLFNAKDSCQKDRLFD